MADAPPAPLPPWPAIDFSMFGPVESRPLPRNQALTAAFLTRNWTMIPHVTHHDEVDIGEFEQRRQAWNSAPGATRLTPLVPLMKAVAAALLEYPVFNSSLDASGKVLTWKKYVHLGVVTETPAGLLVPVIRDCDARSMGELAADLGTKLERARTKGLPMADMSGGCFSISSLGNVGGTAFTPIINAPEVAVLGVLPMAVRPVPTAAGVAWRNVLPLSLSYDHRVINGADAARFVTSIGARLRDPDLFEG
jgi:pyruvate dehydrogenase E2 component (dihydrolipoamide acetyltransferase)